MGEMAHHRRGVQVVLGQLAVHHNLLLEQRRERVRLRTRVRPLDVRVVIGVDPAAVAAAEEMAHTQIRQAL